MDSLDAKYIEIKGFGNLMGTKVKIMFDFGQKWNRWKSSETPLVEDEDGKKFKFNSMVDALNFMAKYGYELDQAYAVEGVYVYLLKRKDFQIKL